MPSSRRAQRCCPVSCGRRDCHAPATRYEAGTPTWGRYLSEIEQLAFPAGLPGRALARSFAWMWRTSRRDAMGAGDKSTQPFLTDIKTLRERARQHMEDGAITPGYG